MWRTSFYVVYDSLVSRLIAGLVGCRGGEGQLIKKLLKELKFGRILSESILSESHGFKSGKILRIFSQPKSQKRDENCSKTRSRRGTKCVVVYPANEMS